MLTGSSARDLADAQKQLAGRHGGAGQPDLLLLPMGFRRFARAMGLEGLPQPDPVRARDFVSPDVDAAFVELLPWLDTLLSTWELYLRVGGFPREVSDQLAHGAVQDDFIRALWDVTAGEAVRGAGTTPAQVQAMLARLTRSLTSPLAVAESFSTARGIARLELDVAGGCCERLQLVGERSDRQLVGQGADPAQSRAGADLLRQALQPCWVRLGGGEFKSEWEYGYASLGIVLHLLVSLLHLIWRTWRFLLGLIPGWVAGTDLGLLAAVGAGPNAVGGRGP